MKTALLASLCLLSCGCFQHRNLAGIAANQYAAGDALSRHPDVQIVGDRVSVPAAYLRMVDAISTAVRLNAIESADLCGFTIPGASEWKASLPPSPPKAGSATPPQP